MRVGEGRGNPQGRGQMYQDGSDRWSFIYSLYHFPTALDPTAYENSTTTTPYPSFNGALVSWAYIWHEGSRDSVQDAIHK